MSEVRAANDDSPIPATEADYAAFRRIRRQARRLFTANAKTDRPWNLAATVGDVARATKMPAPEVVRLIKLCGWLMVVEPTDEPMETWGIWEDGVMDEERDAKRHGRIDRTHVNGGSRWPK